MNQEVVLMVHPVLNAFLGVCCSCQSAHPASRRTDLPSEEIADPMGPYGCGDAGYYAMDAHMIFGKSGAWCDGAGTIPQTIIYDRDCCNPRTLEAR